MFQVGHKHLGGIGKNRYAPFWFKSINPTPKNSSNLGFLGPILVQELSNRRLRACYHFKNITSCIILLRFGTSAYWPSR